jgi:hypothetical protein
LFFLQFNIFIFLIVYEFAARYFNVPAGKRTKDDGKFIALKGQLLLNSRLKRAGPAAKEIDAER